MLKLRSWMDKALNAALIAGLLLFIGSRIVPILRSGELVDIVLRGRLSEQEWRDLTVEGEVLGARVGSEIVLVEFSDYRCPFCRASADTLASFLKSHPDVSVVVKHLPAHGPSSYFLARAAICAGKHIGGFDRDHVAVFEVARHAADTMEVKNTIRGTALAVDQRFFESCLRSPSTDRRVDRDLAWVSRLNITATPTFVGRTGRIVGVPTTGDLQELAFPE